MTKGYQFREVCMYSKYGTTVQYIQKYSTTFSKRRSFNVEAGGAGHWDLGQSIERFETQARNIVPPRLQQINPVQTRGFSLVG